MFARIVRNQYIGKSKIDFTLGSIPIPQTTLIGDLSIPFADNDGHPFTSIDPHLPDVMIQGKITDISTMDIAYEEKTSVLYITGIPKNAPSLDNYRLRGVEWQSYYEDLHRGYLFQLVNIETPVELKNPSNNYESVKIKLKYEANRIHKAV